MLRTCLLAAALFLGGCAHDHRWWDYDAPGSRLMQRHSDFIFEVEGANAKALGCSGYVLCPRMAALLDERMKAARFCEKSYAVNSVGWNHSGQFYATGPCEKIPSSPLERLFRSKS